MYKMRLTGKMANTLPVLKEKKRYITYQLHSKTTIPRAGGVLVEELNKILGVFDAAGAGVIPITHVSSKGVLRVNHKYADKLRVAMLLTTQLKNIPVMIRPLCTSGVIKKAKAAM